MTGITIYDVITIHDSTHPREAKVVSVTGTGSLPECVNKGFVWTQVKRGFVKAAVSRAVRLRECPLRELRLYSIKP